jgi:hypothetical protein
MLPNTELNKRTIVARAAKRLREGGASIFEPLEEPVLVREPLGLGYWLGVKSVRHHELFSLLEKEYCKGLQTYSYYEPKSRVWMRFGFDYTGIVPEMIEDAIVKLEISS